MNQQNGLMTLPFDSTEDNRKEITAVQRRRLYRDLWSDMVVRAFTFTSVGNGNFTVNGTCLVNGAYADFNNVTLSTADVLVGQTQVVVRIVSDGQGGEDVGIRFTDVIGTHDLRIGTATVVAGPVVSQIIGAGLSPIRIPDRTIVGAKLADRTITGAKLANTTITSNELANNSVITRAIADGQVTNAKLADGISANRLTAGTLPAARIATDAITATHIHSDTFLVADIINGSTARTLAPNASRSITHTVPPGYHLIGARPRNNNLSVNGGSRTSTTFSIRNVSSTNTTIAAGATYATLLFIRSGVNTRADQTRQIPNS